MEALTREEILTKKDLLELIQREKDTCVSMYMPTHSVGADTQQNQIRFKNQLRVAAEKLAEAGTRPPDAEALLARAQELLRNAPFWKRQSDGLAVFLSPDFFRCYRLPVEFRERVIVAERFHIKPILPLFSMGGRFFVIALSQNKLRLLQGARNCVSEMDTAALPKNLAETVKYDVSEKQVRSQPAASAAGGRGASFHGHGGWTDESKDHLQRYLQQIDRGLRGMLKDERAPLVFAGVEYIFSMYREINSYPQLLEKAITGNPEGLSNEELGKQAWNLVRPFYLKAQDEAVAQFRQSAGTGLASANIAEIVPAACHGRIGLLLVARGREQWGTFDPRTSRLTLQEKPEKGAEDLLDLAAIQAFLNGGTVYMIEPDRMPGREPIAALFRY